MSHKNLVVVAGVVTLLVAPVVALVVATSGGGKQSAVEGKLVYKSGKPAAALRISAAQSQPVKGYEHFEAVSDAEGVFRMRGLFPSSRYVLTPWAGSSPYETFQIDTPTQGKTFVLPAAILLEPSCRMTSEVNSQLSIYEGAIDMCALDNRSQWPSALQDLVSGNHKYVNELKKDPWGNDYIYRPPVNMRDKNYTLLSAGPDGVADTADDVALPEFRQKGPLPTPLQ